MAHVRGVHALILFAALAEVKHINKRTRIDKQASNLTNKHEARITGSVTAELEILMFYNFSRQ